jgi:EAL domain-containing protein (putative c-di-GMP-specific phosphodiesterase class I)
MTTTLGRVLVVDDDAAMRRTCARALGHDGWDVVMAESGHVAIEQLRGKIEFDCVVSDVHMPGVDGFQLVAEIRKHDDDIPVLLMTGDPSLDGAVRAIDTGAVSYLSKPFDHEMLLSAVARAARRHGVARMRRRADSYASKLVGTDDLVPRFENALARAWMAFQPIVDIHHKRIFAYEALLRTDEESLKRPDLFIGTAERLDRIHDLGRTVRAAVARSVSKLPGDALLFVNVHGLELTDESLFSTSDPLAPLAHRTVLEITERIGLDEVAGPSRVAMLRKLGYRIAVDDLGAGYAALGALATLEPEVVKLDMSLIRDIDRQPTKRRVVGAIATLCRELGSNVVAEGVETQAEAAVVIELGIQLVQGYLYARPTREIVSYESLTL